MASRYVSRPFDELTPADLDDALDVDVRAAYACSLAAVPHLRSAGGGRIVNVSDWVAASGRPRYPGFLPYYVAKSAVIGLTEALALELAGDDILVNAVAPGPIRASGDLDSDAVERVAQATPLGRWGGDEEIVKAVTSLGRVRLHHRRDDSGGWRETSEVRRPEFRRQNTGWTAF